MKLKEILKDKLSEDELKLVTGSFDFIGSKEKMVCIIETEKIKSKEKQIAEAIMQTHKNVKSVLARISERKGCYRLANYRLIAGGANTEVIHKEYGYLLKLDPQKVYFSPREATERQRIASQVKPNEKVLVMFSGICPYAIAIAKKQPKIGKIYAIEINPNAHEYAKENVRINKLSHKIVPICGDVRKACKKIKEKFDRIVMPLPLGAENFLDIAIDCLKENGIIHFYSWGEEPEIFEKAISAIEEQAKRLNKKIEILGKRKVLPYKPRTYKVCIEFKVKQG